MTQHSTLALPQTATSQQVTKLLREAQANTPDPTPEQVVAIQALLDFVQDPDPGHNFFVLSGYAGTGKTFCMRNVIERSRGSRVEFAFTAPTNKAAKELRKVTGEARTIFSLLGLRIDKSGELKELVSGEKPDLSEIDVIFIDEGGMVNKNLMDHLKAHVNDGRLKVVFMGDEAQLPPVGEVRSPVWIEDLPTAKLTTVMRHDNQILNLVTHIRTQVFSMQSNIVLKSDNDGNEGVWKMTKAAFKTKIFQEATDGLFADGQKKKVIAWRNVKVGEYNDLIRGGIFGADARSGYFLPGERVIAAGPCKSGDDMLLATDEEGVVESVRESVHPAEPKYKMLELKTLTEDGRYIRLWILHPESQALFSSDCESLAHQARANGKLWRKFWLLKDLFHEVKYAYAVTAHRAQGSTYQDVFVDTGDILLNRTRKEALQCLYVACSRPTTRLYLA